MQPQDDPNDRLRTRPGPSGARELVDRFHTAWSTAQKAAGADPLLLPDRLAAACVTVLPIDGAGLSLIEDRFRIPLGASDATAAFAEQLQFTQGDGPCLEAASQRSVIAAGATDIERRWPQFADELLTGTPYRAVISVPLALHRDATGALDMFLIDETHLDGIRLTDAAGIAAAIVDALQAADDVALRNLWSTPDVPVWLTSPRAQKRQLVWVATGMVMQQFHTGAENALAALRAHAYGHDRTVDDLAARLVDGDVDLNDLQP
jgi:hypothetical protein